jgi:ABC-type phosphate transport system permease subunit
MLTVTAAGIGAPIGIQAGIYMAEYRKYAKLSWWFDSSTTSC